MRTIAQHRSERGFILPLAVLLVVILSISGMSFLHHDYLERRMVMNEVRNHDAFYLSSAGIERGREAYKFSLKPDGTPDWTPMLDDTHLDHRPEFPTDTAPFCLSADPNSCLCPPNLLRGCVIPPFQTPLSSPLFAARGALDGDPVIFVPGEIPFSGLFDDGEYTVRAYNDESTKTDVNGDLVIRALGAVRREQKLLEVTVRAESGLKLINCDSDVAVECPDIAGSSNPTIQALPGRAPAGTPDLPTLPPLADPTDPTQCNPANFYCNTANFSNPAKRPHITSIPSPLPGGTILSSSGGGGEVIIKNNTFYLIQGDVELRDITNTHDVIVFSLGTLTVKPAPVTITNAILIGASGVQMRGNLTINQPFPPLPYPTIISGGDIKQLGSASVVIYGSIYAYPPATIDFNPITVYGVIIGTTVSVQGSSSTFSDLNNSVFYTFMPGFAYPDDLLTTSLVLGASWKEIQ